MERDYNVAALVKELPNSIHVTLAKGEPTRRVEIGRDVRPGDLLAVRYAGARQYGHIGTFYADANQNGVLDGEDLVLHAGPDALHTSRLDEGGFDGEVAVLRP